jgi:hypothetical protein
LIQRRTGLKRTGPIRPKPRRRPRVERWEALREQVLRRDVTSVVTYFREAFGMDELNATFDGKLTIHAFGSFEACMATLMDFEEIGACAGRWELNHVGDPALVMKGRKPPDDPDHLVSLCEYHHRGSAAGYNWASARRNKALQWEYLEEQRHAREEAV